MWCDPHRADPNPNHWYVVARSCELVGEGILPITLWNEPIALFRNRAGEVQALEDRCPHRHVKLSHGRLVEDQIECAYHGWRFDSGGRCSHVPYLQEHQVVPSCRLRRYPVRELDGFLWVFPGEPQLAEAVEPLGLPQWNQLDQVASVAVIDTKAHFSFLIENLMDMHHGHLHDRYQAWTEATLIEVGRRGGRVEALYAAKTPHRIDGFPSLARSWIPWLRRLHNAPLQVNYIYPHWVCSLGDDFTICCLLGPVGPEHTRAYLIHFTSLAAFKDLTKLPDRFRRWVRNRMFNSARGLLEGLVRQDVEMIEEEQAFHRRHPERRSVELNRTLVEVQRLITAEAERRQSGEAPSGGSPKAAKVSSIRATGLEPAT